MSSNNTDEKTTRFNSLLDDFKILIKKNNDVDIQNIVKDVVLLDFLRESSSLNNRSELMDEFIDLKEANPKWGEDLISILSETLEQLRTDIKIKKMVSIQPEGTLSKLLYAHYKEQLPSLFPEEH